MPDQSLLIKDVNGKITFKVNSENGFVTVGGNDQGGIIVVNDSAKKHRVAVNGNEGALSVRNAAGKELFRADSTGVTLGGPGGAGALNLLDAKKTLRIMLAPNGSVLLLDETGKITVALSPDSSSVRAGGGGHNGELTARAADALGAAKLFILDKAAGGGGSVVLTDKAGKETIRLKGQNASVGVGGDGMDGVISVLGSDDTPLAELIARPTEAVIGIGNKGRPGRISLFNENGTETISIRGVDGDIVLQGADCAEQFQVIGDVEPGSVLVMDDDGNLELSRKAYDTRVAGVVSGAGAYKPGIVLGGSNNNAGRVPVALVGRVMCLADASVEPIRVGDLLTTAARAPGHAMKATNRRRALGTLLGKSLGSLPSGQGLIPILVALQ